MGNFSSNTISNSVQFDSEIKFSRKPLTKVESIGENSESHSAIDDVVIRLNLINFEIESLEITYQIIIENKKDKDLVIKQIIYNDKIKWWRSFCIQVILPNEKSMSLKDLLTEFNRLNHVYQKEKLSSFKYLILQKKQKIYSDVIKYQFKNSIFFEDTKNIFDMLNEITNNAKNERVYFVAELIENDLTILDKNYENSLKSKKYAVWKNNIYPIITEKVEFNDEKNHEIKDELEIDSELIKISNL
jgi:hypothetical protein